MSQIDMAVGLLDFSKAFEGNIHLWIATFLKNRDQRVVVDCAQSDAVHMDLGVPQGTVLGPLLFLLHINNLPQNVNSKVRLFVDDCLLYHEIHNEQDQLTLQNVYYCI